MALHEAGATVRVISPVSTPELGSFAAPRFSLEAREYHGPSDLSDADLVVAATGTSADARVAADARKLHRLVNVASSPGDSSFVTMAVHRSGPVSIGVTTGELPRAAMKIRDSLAARFDNRYARAIETCAEIRKSKLADNGSADWVRLQESLIGDDFCERIENGSFDEVAAQWR